MGIIMPIMKQLAEAFRERRIRLGLTQQQAAAAAGLSRRTISDFENGMTVLPHYRDADLSSFGCVLNGIVQEVYYDLLEPGRIGLNLDRFTADRCKRNAFFLCE